MSADPRPAPSAADHGASIELKGVVQEFPRPEGEGVVRVLDGIDLLIEEPSIYMLLSPSGCGSRHGPYWFIMFDKGEL